MSTNQDNSKSPAEEIIERCFAHYKKGDSDAAIAECTKAIEVDPTDPRPYQIRASELAAKGLFRQAWEDIMYCVVLGYKPAPIIVQTVQQKSGQSWPLDRMSAVAFILMRHPFFWIDFGNTQTALSCLNKTSFAHISDARRPTAPHGIIFHISHHPEDNTATLMIGGPSITADQMSELAQIATNLGGTFTKAKLLQKPEWKGIFEKYLEPNVGTKQALEFSFIEDQ